MGASVIGAWAAGARATKQGFDASVSLAQLLKRRRSARRQSAQGLALIGVKNDDMFQYRVAMRHPNIVPGQPHPDDALAFVSIASRSAALAMEQQRFTEIESIPADLDSGFVLLGSPEAEVLTSVIFGYRRKEDGTGMEYLGNTLELPFRWQEDSAKVEAECTRMVPGSGKATRPNWPVVDSTGLKEKLLYPRVANDGMIYTDYLLITRVPNFMTSVGFESRRSIISVAGTHGTGTRSVERLLGDRSALAAIAAEIGPETEACQILVEASDISHSKLSGSVARKVRVVSMVKFDRPEWKWISARNAASLNAKFLEQ